MEGKVSWALGGSSGRLSSILNSDSTECNFTFSLTFIVYKFVIVTSCRRVAVHVSLTHVVPYSLTQTVLVLYDALIVGGGKQIHHFGSHLLIVRYFSNLKIA